MQHSDAPFIELTKARAAITAMRKAKSLDEFEEQWKEFLGRLERVWNKAFSHFGKSPKWNGWKGKTEGLRKTDPLLSYLVNARGAEEHTVNEIVGRRPSGIGINAAEGNSLYIKRMEINDGNIFIQSPQLIRVDGRVPGSGVRAEGVGFAGVALQGHPGGRDQEVIGELR